MNRYEKKVVVFFLNHLAIKNVLDLVEIVFDTLCEL